MSFRSLIEAIEADDRAAVRKLLRSEAGLVHVQFDQARLFWAEIRHWIYVGDTALHLAAAGYRAEIVRRLLASGADPNAAANHRRSGPLHYAADSGPGKRAWDPGRQVETIGCLLKAGARINSQDKNGATPLHRAVRTRGAEAVRFLLKAGADPLLKNKPGSTPFHLAVQNTGRGGSGSDAAKEAQRMIIQEFLSLGVSVRLKDGKGKAVLDCAGSEWIREIFR